MALIKTIKSGKTTIEIHSNTTPEERKDNLINVYRTINKIADKKRAEGVNVDNWFYTQEQLTEMKKSGNYKFI